jgi:DNA-binding NarL/FixJ family response regulator
LGASTLREKVFLVVEADPRLQDLLQSVLRPEGWRPLVASSAAEALARLDGGGEAPEVAIVDLAVPDADGASLIGRLAGRWPELPIVVLTSPTTGEHVIEALRRGARGYLFKDDLARGLGWALDEAAAGGAPMSRAVTRLLLEQLRTEPEAKVRNANGVSLTDGERRVVEQLARGLSYEEVGSVLEISANTVRSYIRTLYEKLCVSSKTEAVLTAMQLGLIDMSVA